MQKQLQDRYILIRIKESKVQDTAENEIHLGVITTQFLTPYINERLAARNLSIDPNVGASKFSVNVESLLTDLLFENLVYDKHLHIVDILEDYSELADNIDEILQLIDGEIDTT